MEILYFQQFLIIPLTCFIDYIIKYVDVGIRNLVKDCDGQCVDKMIKIPKTRNSNSTVSLTIHSTYTIYEIKMFFSVLRGFLVLM